MKRLLLVLTVLLLAAPAMAARWNFYGGARFDAFAVDEDSTDHPGASAIHDQGALQERQDYGRIGETLEQRDLCTTYDLGGAELLVGRTHTPSNYFFRSDGAYENDGDLSGLGRFRTGRKPMIQLTYENLKLAFVKPEMSKNYGRDTDALMPKIEASYNLKGETFFVDVFGGYQVYGVDASVAQGAVRHEVDSCVFGFGGGVEAGPLYFNAGFHAGRNLGNYGVHNSAGLHHDKAEFHEDSGEFVDQQGTGCLAVLGFKANERLTLEAGYGREESGLADRFDYKAYASLYYLNATFNITKDFFIVPEIGRIECYDEGDGTAEPEPEVLYGGAKWQINF